MRFTLGFLLATAALAQAPSVPLIDPRGVVDYFNPSAPAPVTVARGGILEITGTNLGPASTVSASKPPLPTTLGNPSVEATLNGEAMPLFSVNANAVIAQVPYDATVGVGSVVVSVGGVTGPAARVTIAATQPSIQTADGSGTGVFAGNSGGSTVTLEMSGLGVTNPALGSGALPPNAKVKPTAALVAFIGGVRTTAAATASTRNVGQFDVVVDVPASAQPGDLIYMLAGGRPSNLVLYQPLGAPAIQMLPLPSGSPAILSLATPDVTGSFIIPYAAKDPTGCFAALWFDMISGNSGSLAPCLATPARGATSPLVLPANSEIAGGLVGPPAGTQPAGVSANVLIADADNDAMTTVALTGEAAQLAGTTGSAFLASIPGPPAQTDMINGLTGAVTTTNAAGAGAGGGGAAGAPTSVNVNGLTSIVTAAVLVAPGQYGLVATDDPQFPTQAAYAVVQADGTVLASQAFPTGWLPLLPAAATPTSPAVLESASLNAATHSIYLLVRAADASQDGFLIIPEDASAAPTLSPMPAGWWATSCSGAIKLTAVTLYPGLVLPGSNVVETSYRNPCGAAGYLELDLTAGVVSAYPVGVNSQLVATSLVNVNDFIYGTDANKNLSDTLYVFDSASLDAYTIQLPAGSPSFGVIQAVAGTDWLLAPLTTRSSGDGGFVQFDLDAGVASVFPLPSGFTNVQILDTFLATNKFAVRGLSQGAYQLLIYDQLGNMTPVPNPNGVASFGPPPAATAAAAARQPIPVGNPKANTVAAIAYDGSGNQIGVLLAQVP